MFSPRYAKRIRRGEPALPTEHAAINLALYRGGRCVAWVMTEHAGRFAETNGAVTVGDSTLARSDRGGFEITIDDRTAPFFAMFRGGDPVSGTITVEPLSGPLPPSRLSAETAPAHHWQVIAPRARIVANFSAPAFSVETTGYHDTNWGEGRLEDAFSRWGWARFHGASHSHVLYALTDRDGTRRALVAGEGSGASLFAVPAPPAPEEKPVPVGWGLVAPPTFGAAGDRPLSCARGAIFEAAPFYVRFHATPGDSDDKKGDVGFGEWLDLDRFRSRWVQFLLRFKMRFAAPK